MAPLPTRRGAEVGLVSIRRMVLGIFLFGLLGTGTELLLLGHTEGLGQLTPLLLMLTSILVLGWYAALRSPAGLRAFQGTMILFLLSGCAGLYLHYQGNVEFELEMYPSRRGLELFWEAIRGATPALSPGTMMVLGFLGLAYSYRHPVFLPPTDAESTTERRTT